MQSLRVGPMAFKERLKDALQFFSRKTEKNDFILPVKKTLITEIDEEVVKIQKELISEKDYQKLQNQFESDFVNSNSTIEGIANSLSEYYVSYDGNTNLINKELELYKSITREEIRAVAQKYLTPNQRLELHYLPEPQKEEKWKKP